MTEIVDRINLFFVLSACDDEPREGTWLFVPSFLDLLSANTNTALSTGISFDLVFNIQLPFCKVQTALQLVINRPTSFQRLTRP